MGSAAVEKTAEELRKEIEELNRQQWEITERLRDPRGLRRGLAANISNANATGIHTRRNHSALTNPPRRPRGVPERDRADAEGDDQPPPKRRLSSAVVKVKDGELVDDSKEKAINNEQADKEDGAEDNFIDDKRLQKGPAGLRRDSGRTFRADVEALPVDQVPRVLPKDEDPNLVKRNKRMFVQLLGTLEKFREEDMHLSSTKAYMRRSDSLRRAEQRAREESERLRQQEREQLAEKRRRDLALRARVTAKAEEKKLELLFLHWSEHHKRLCNFLRTKSEPPIFYLPAKPLEGDPTLVDQRKERSFQEWKDARRAELSEYQKHIEEQYLANVEAELERWQNANARSNTSRVNNAANLQETMDKELESHRQAHGPKNTSRIPRGGEVDEDVEDDDDMLMMMDDVLQQPEADDDIKDAGNAVPLEGGSN
ncbi:pinin [Amborella trichopoda]|uniref:Pinin/SDK/MemA protein domain-containing protein n=1 Tax=Amborella trichopoda TaxID=13333 RepID=W1NNU8_AMBTC|nr:pinin [Amborella trichopoda]ERM97606.1 hypothetical protein AMTR_s00173p00035440 [Amborella trichopoda]|eukprot:XP_006830190.1 pinin [Amborella trichopoda]